MLRAQSPSKIPKSNSQEPLEAQAGLCPDLHEVAAVDLTDRGCTSADCLSRMQRICWCLPVVLPWLCRWADVIQASRTDMIDLEDVVCRGANLHFHNAVAQTVFGIDGFVVPDGRRVINEALDVGCIMSKQWEAGWTRQVMIGEVYVIPRITKKLKPMQYRRTGGFDPATRPCLQGHCLYACLHYSRWRTTPTKMDMVKLRRSIAYAWKQVPETLESQARAEGLSPKAYLKAFIYQGWGGLPEVRLMDKLYPGMNVRIKDLTGAQLWASEQADSLADVWRFTGTHYFVESSGLCTWTPSVPAKMASARGGMRPPQHDGADMDGITRIEYIECAYCLACKCWMGPGHLDTFEHKTTMQQMFALGEEMARRVLEARRHSFLAQHEPEMEDVVDSKAYVKVGNRRFCLGCMQWAERRHDDSPLHRRFLEQLHQWDQATQDEFLSLRAQRSLEVMTDPPSRGGKPVVLRSRSPMCTSDSPTRTRVTLRSRSPPRPRINEEEQTEKMPYVPSSLRRLPEHVVLYRKHPYCLLCGKWDDKPRRDSKHHITRVYDFMANEPEQRTATVKDWHDQLSRQRMELERGANENRVYVYLRDWKNCLACQQWEDEIHGKTETHLKRVARFSKMTSRDQAYFLAEQREKAEHALRGGMQTNEAPDHEELTPVLEDAVEPQSLEEAPARLAPQMPQYPASSSRDNSGDGHAAVAVAGDANDNDLTDSESDSALGKALVDSLSGGRVCEDGEFDSEASPPRCVSFMRGGLSRIPSG